MNETVGNGATPLTRWACCPCPGYRCTTRPSGQCNGSNAISLSSPTQLVNPRPVLLPLSQQTTVLQPRLTLLEIQPNNKNVAWMQRREEHGMPWGRDASVNGISHASFTGENGPELRRLAGGWCSGRRTAKPELSSSVRSPLLSSCHRDGLAVNIGDTWSKQKWHIPNPPVGKETRERSGSWGLVARPATAHRLGNAGLRGLARRGIAGRGSLPQRGVRPRRDKGARQRKVPVLPGGKDAEEPGEECRGAQGPPERRSGSWQGFLPHRPAAAA